MQYEAIYHQPLSNYAFAIDQEHVVFRLKAAKNDLIAVYICIGDTAFRGNPVLFTKYEMKIQYEDLYVCYYEVTIKNPTERMVYYFELKDTEKTVYYYADMFKNSVSDERNDLFKFPFHRYDDIIDVPSWLKKACVYNIFPDSFATSKRSITKIGLEKEFEGKRVSSKLGGTIIGIMENLDYIKSTGFNTIYMNPLFTAGEYHKYDLIDYYSIDPCFGTNEDFKKLVEKAHEMDMKVIIDGVFNHAGWHFFAFDDVIRNQEKSKYKDWFYRLDFPIHRPITGDEIPPYSCFGYERMMPKLKTTNKEVVDYFLDVCAYWIENYDIDGWRLDVADEVDANFWRQFRNRAKSIKNDVAIIGEVWQSAQSFLDGSMFDSVMNYDFSKHSKSFFAYLETDALVFNSNVTQMMIRYRKNMTYGQLNLLDSHDVPRFLSHCKNDENRYKLAVVFLLTFVGAPMVFYGDEQGLTGIKEDEYRRPMEFDHHSKMKAFYHELLSLRQKHEVLSLGDFKTIYAESSGGLYIFDRYNDHEKIRIILNRNNEKREVLSFGKVLFSNGYDGRFINPYSFAIVLE
jgi:cyclomaltodextrinase / maltogenic alpha-amylase / neopullulanase